MKLIAQIKSMAIQLKAVSGVIVSVGVIASASLWISSTVNNSSESQDANFKRVLDTLAVMNRNIEYLSIENSNQDEQLQGIHDTLLKIDSENEEQTENIETLGWAISKINVFDPEVIEEILERELKKNSESSLAPERGPTNDLTLLLSEINTDIIKAK